MKKGQVTLFVIIGVVLVIAAILFIALRRDITDPSPDLPDVTHDFSQVEAVYEAAAARCLESEGKLILKEIFAHGGYFDPEEQGFFAVENLETAGSALLLGDSFLLPFWLEQTSSAGCRDDCHFKTSIPPLTRDDLSSLSSIEDQMITELHPVVKSCLNKIRFSKDYDVVMADDYAVDVVIGDGVVSYILNRVVEFTFLANDAQKTVTEVQGRTQVDAKALYENAIALINFVFLMEKNDTMPFLMRTIIQAYGMGADPGIPPMFGGTKLETGYPTTWVLSDVKNFLKFRLADNIPLMQVRYSNEQQIFTDPSHYSQALYHTRAFKPDIIFPYEWTVGRTSFSFMFNPSWDIDLKVTPGNYLIKPDSSLELDIPFLFSIGTREYNFEYDLVVPLMISLTDNAAFDGEGLSLLFAVESGLAANNPIIYNDILRPASSVDNMFVLDDLYMRGYISMIARDGLSGDVLENVGVDYLCGDNNIIVGETDIDGLLVENLPFCMGGILMPSLEGYYGDIAPLSIVNDDDFDVDLSLYPFKEFKLEPTGFLLSKLQSADVIYDEVGGLEDAFKDVSALFEGFGIDIHSGIWAIGDQESHLGVDDSLIMIFTRRVGPGEEPQIEVKNINFSTENEQVIKLAKGTYDVEAFLMTNFGEGFTHDSFIIPEDEVCWGENWLFDGEEGCEIIDAVVFNTSLYLGGVTLTGDTALELIVDDYSKDTLYLPYIRIKHLDLKKHVDLGVLGVLDGYAWMFNESLTPQFR